MPTTETAGEASVTKDVTKEVVDQVAKEVANSTLLAIAGRIATLVMVPVMLGWIWWMSGQMQSLGQRMSVVEAQRIVGRNEIIGRIERLETAEGRDRDALTALQRQMAGLEATSAAILREIENMRRDALMRDSALRDQQRPR